MNCGCGQLFPGAATSGDIDIILGHPDYTSESAKRPPYIRRVVQRMESAGFVTDTLSLGESKFMVGCIYAYVLFSVTIGFSYRECICIYICVSHNII